MQRQSVIVIGAGLSGLACARIIQRAGHYVHLYEASDAVGGRVRTDYMDGFLLDRGFQVLFPAYPAVQTELDLNALRLHSFLPGALIHLQDKLYLVADPSRAPSTLLATAFAPIFTLKDRFLVLRLKSQVKKLSVENLFQQPDKTTEQFLKEYGFTNAFINHFIRPFYGSIFLETRLHTSVRMFAFVFKMLAESQATLPENGMGAIAQQIASSLAANSLHLNSPVAALWKERDRVKGIILENGEHIEADKVVLATEFHQAAKLAGLHLPATWRSATTVYFALPQALYPEKAVVLFPGVGRLVTSAALVSNIAPSYAPPRQHLLACNIVGDPAMEDEELVQRAKQELAAAFPYADTGSWRHLRTYRIRHAQFAQLPGIWELLPSAQTPYSGLILAGEITVSSSIHGALVSGRRAAELALETTDLPV
ncbi:UDP-galactopyranose mutase [Chthonomonas calidirosea]|uniref:NAD(P)/FAD-dependent oxidoreductase n=1 Tax=Chthonomonas calidirosea TaxID=454171 RepID=UPI0006DD4D1C|nr:NAD(P)/FAD-dependent oxidoreductase [Chthonomonas calidirosea]CEK13669.1 UDP-galactopyranose mutase [Chthonomonas calidirosea]